MKTQHRFRRHPARAFAHRAGSRLAAGLAGELAAAFAAALAAAPAAALAAALVLLGAKALAAPPGGIEAGEGAAPPARLAGTGLFVAGSSRAVRPGVLAFTPQYPLWSDGSAKRRWIALPAGAAIDAAKPDAWRFPVGTRLWKEFAVGARRVETRFIERTESGWRFATYVWNDAGDEALLAPARGIAAMAVEGAPGGRYTVPGRGDCLACHGGAPAPVLGFSALQLSPAHEPSAPASETSSAASASASASISVSVSASASVGEARHVDLATLAAAGLLRDLGAGLLARPPRIPARSALERAALGTLHGNCAHCHHRAGGQVPLPLTLQQRVADPQAALDEVLASTLGVPARFRTPGQAGMAPAAAASATGAGSAGVGAGGAGAGAGVSASTNAPVALIVEPGAPERSVLVHRMATRNPLAQMPPLGTSVPDPEGLALVRRWIASANPPTLPPAP